MSNLTWRNNCKDVYARKITFGAGTLTQPIGPLDRIVDNVTIKADDDNANDVYVGNAGVTSSAGFRLKAGQALPNVRVVDLGVVFVLGTSGQSVWVFAEVPADTAD